jgi:hypothetical protein
VTHALVLATQHVWQYLVGLRTVQPPDAGLGRQNGSADARGCTNKKSTRLYGYTDGERGCALENGAEQARGVHCRVPAPNVGNPTEERIAEQPTQVKGTADTRGNMSDAEAKP